MMPRSTLAALALVAASLASLEGCALFSRGSSMQPRYFSADIAPPTAPRSDHAPATASAGDESMVLRLGKIRAGTDLKEEIVYRTSSHELGFYDEYRWAERPEVYLRRGLVQALYTERGLKQSLVGAVPTLDVELVTFEEVRGEQPVAHVSLMVALHDDRVVRYFRTIEVNRPLKANDQGKIEPAVLATGLTEALYEAVRQVSDDVVRELGATAKTMGKAAENGPLKPSGEGSSGGERSGRREGPPAPRTRGVRHSGGTRSRLARWPTIGPRSTREWPANGLRMASARPATRCFDSLPASLTPRVRGAGGPSRLPLPLPSLRTPLPSALESSGEGSRGGERKRW